MTRNDFAEELRVASDLARRAGALALAMQSTGLKVDHKAHEEPVTAADRAANQLIVDGLRAAFPHDAILSEELPDDLSRLQHDRVWMVDPIDGTKDFIRGDVGFAAMIGLLVGDSPAVGAVYQPSFDRLYTAVRGHGSFLSENGAANLRLHVSDISDTTLLRMVASKSHRDERIDEVRARLGVTDETNVGSVGLKLGLIARGERDLYVNPVGHSKLWDACAPEVILVEAGGRMTDARGRALAYRGKELGNLSGLIASNGRVHDDIVAKLAGLFGAPAKS